MPSVDGTLDCDTALTDHCSTLACETERRYGETSTRVGDEPPALDGLRLTCLGLWLTALGDNGGVLMATSPRASDFHPLALEVCSCSSATIRVLEPELRRRVLASLLEQRTAGLTDLSSELTLDAENSHTDVDVDDEQSVAASLYHTHIPKLEAAGLVSVDRDDDALTVHLHRDIYGGPLTPHLLRSVDQEVWSAVAAVYRDRRRGEVLTLLARAGTTLTVASLASRLFESQGRASSPTVGESSETRTEVEATLQHVHLPALAKAGLVEYDTTSSEVTYTGDQFFELVDFVDTLPPRMRTGW